MQSPSSEKKKEGGGGPERETLKGLFQGGPGGAPAEDPSGKVRPRRALPCSTTQGHTASCLERGLQVPWRPWCSIRSGAPSALGGESARQTERGRDGQSERERKRERGAGARDAASVHRRRPASRAGSRWPDLRAGLCAEIPPEPGRIPPGPDIPPGCRAAATGAPKGPLACIAAGVLGTMCRGDLAGAPAGSRRGSQGLRLRRKARRPPKIQVGTDRLETFCNARARASDDNAKGIMFRCPCSGIGRARGGGACNTWTRDTQGPLPDSHFGPPGASWPWLPRLQPDTWPGPGRDLRAEAGAEVRRAAAVPAGRPSAHGRELPPLPLSPLSPVLSLARSESAHLGLSLFAAPSADGAQRRVQCCAGPASHVPDMMWCGPEHCTAARAGAGPVRTDPLPGRVPRPPPSARQMGHRPASPCLGPCAAGIRRKAPQGLRGGSRGGP